MSKYEIGFFYPYLSQFLLKGTEDVFSKYPPFLEWYIRFTRVPFKSFSVKLMELSLFFHWETDLLLMQ